jgi:hypothetical protein
MSPKKEKKDANHNARQPLTSLAKNARVKLQASREKKEVLLGTVEAFLNRIKDHPSLWSKDEYGFLPDFVDYVIKHRGQFPSRSYATLEDSGENVISDHFCEQFYARRVAAEHSPANKQPLTPVFFSRRNSLPLSHIDLMVAVTKKSRTEGKQAVQQLSQSRAFDHCLHPTVSRHPRRASTPSLDTSRRRWLVCCLKLVKQ